MAKVAEALELELEGGADTAPLSAQTRRRSGRGTESLPLVDGFVDSILAAKRATPARRSPDSPALDGFVALLLAMTASSSSNVAHNPVATGRRLNASPTGALPARLRR